MAYSINVNRFVGNLNEDYSTGKTFKNKTVSFFNFEKCCYINVLYGHFRCKRMPHKQNWNKIIITVINRVVRIINDCVSNILSHNVTHLKPRRKSCPHTVKQQAAAQRPARTQCILLCVFVKIRPFGNPLVFLFFFFPPSKRVHVCRRRNHAVECNKQHLWPAQRTKGQEVCLLFFCGILFS